MATASLKAKVVFVRNFQNLLFLYEFGALFGIREMIGAAAVFASDVAVSNGFVGFAASFTFLDRAGAVSGSVSKSPAFAA